MKPHDNPHGHFASAKTRSNIDFQVFETYSGAQNTYSGAQNIYNATKNTFTLP